MRLKIVQKPYIYTTQKKTAKDVSSNVTFTVFFIIYEIKVEKFLPLTQCHELLHN